MSTAIVVLWGAHFIIAGLLLWQRFENPAFAWGLRLGFFPMIIDMCLDYLMTSPTARRRTGAAGGGLEHAGKGVTYARCTSSGCTISFTGWLVARRKRWPLARRVALDWTASGFYLGVMGCLAGAAGQPHFLPDALTLCALTSLVIISVVAVRIIFRFVRPQVVQNPKQGSLYEGNRPYRVRTPNRSPSP